MGALIQTKGTQKLAKWLNNRFDPNGIIVLRKTQSTGGAYSGLLSNAFKIGNSLWQISDAFTAQYATNATGGTATWPADGNDILYPSATMIPTNTGVSTSTLKFSLVGQAKKPDFIVPNATVTDLTTRGNVPSGTKVSTVTAVAGGFEVGLPTAVTIAPGDMISFADGNHERLVRRWRWYLQHDLTAENQTAIRDAIFTALDDTSFKRINFQTVEDTQRVIVTTQQRLNNNDELDDFMLMFILLMTQSTTAPEKVDAQ